MHREEVGLTADAPFQIVDTITIAGGDPQRDAPAVYHLAIGTMQEALARHEPPTDADVAHVANAALALVEMHRGT